MQTFVRPVLIVSLWALHASCVAASEEQSTVELPTIPPLEMVYKAKDPQEQPVEDGAMLGQLRRAAALATRFPLRETRSETSTSWMDVTGSQVTVDTAEKVFVVRYGAQSRFVKDGTMTGSALDIKIPYQIDRSDRQVRIGLTFPATATLTYKRLLLPARKLWSMPEITDDYRRIATALEHAELRLVTVVRGELGSPYKPDAIAANLERILGRPSGSASRTPGTATSQASVYNVNLGGARQQLAVSIYPYRDGTKLLYQAEVPFTLRFDGASSGSEAIEALRSLMTKAVND